MTKQEIDEIYNKLDDIGLGKLADKFLKNPEGFDFSVLEDDPNFVENYSNIAEFLDDHKKIMAEIYQKLDGKAPSLARFESLQAKYPWLNAEELKDWFDRTNAYKEFYKAEAEKEAAKNLRTKEVKQADSWKDYLLSDYSKQRYIDDPNASMYGEQGSFNPYSSEGQEEIRDLILGGFGAVTDAIPGVGPAFVGPAFRAGRDIYHKVSDSPYKKDWQQIGTDFGKDLGTNLGAALLFNARRGQRMVSKATDPNVKRALDANLERANITKGLETINNYNFMPSAEDIGKYYKYNDRTLRIAVNDMPDSELKRKAMKIVNTKPGKPINRKALEDLYLTYKTQNIPVARDFIKVTDERLKPQSTWATKEITPYLQRQADAPTFKELSAMQKGQFLLNKLAMGINYGAIGQIAVQEGANLYGRGNKPSVIDTLLNKDRNKDIERIISSYSVLWNKDNPPPEAKNNSLIMEAWKKWSNND